MASKRITKSAVDSAQPADKDSFIWDDKLAGFGVKITPKGAKTFLYQFRMGGRGTPVRRLTLGKFGTITADKARTLAEDAAFKVAQGTDPQIEKTNKAKQAVDLAFTTYVERFHTDCLKVDWPASHQEAKALLVRHAQPTLGKKPLPSIGKADINAVIAATRAHPSTASHVFAVLRRLFNWAVEQGDIDRSPIVGMRPPPLPVARDRVLSDDELARVWRASDGLGYPFTGMVRLLVLTAARREEVAGLEWSELDQTNRTWTLPAARSKNATALVAPLSNQAVAELDALAARTRKDGKWPKQGLLFSTTGKTSVSGFSRAKSRLDKLVVKQAEKEAKASGEEVQATEP